MRRLRREDGLALPLALGVLLVTSIMLVTIVEYSSSNARSAARGKGQQNAFSLAEAGLNNTFAVLFKPGVNVLQQGLMPSCALPEANWNLSTYDGGTVRWCGTVDLAKNVWNVKAIGIVDNPTGVSASNLRRTLTAVVPIEPQPTTDNTAQAWNYMFSTRTGTPSGCDLTYSNNVVIGSNVYAMGNLCLDQNVVVSAPKVIVKGKIQIANNGRIGQSGTNNWSTRVETQVGGVGGYYCKYSTGAWQTTCGDAQRVYSKDAAATAMTVSFTPESITAPAPEWDNWYANSAPGPKIACTYSSGTPPTFENETSNPTRNNSVPTVFELTPASTSYECRVGPASDPTGQISWDSVAKLLTVRGTIFIDGSIKAVNTAVVSYTGYATIYVSGTFLMDNGAKLCAVVKADGTDCDYVGWDPNTRMLAVIANGDGSLSGVQSQTGSTSDGGGNGIKLVNNTRFQGALQATKAVQLQNNSKVDGPIIASTVVVDNNVTPDAFPTITTVPSGLPGNPAVYAQPLSPTKFSG